jgi:hypothetical protein
VSDLSLTLPQCGLLRRGQLTVIEPALTVTFLLGSTCRAVRGTTGRASTAPATSREGRCSDNAHPHDAGGANDRAAVNVLCPNNDLWFRLLGGAELVRLAH